MYVLNTHVKGEPNERGLLNLSGDVGHECQVLDQTARLALRSVRWAEHTPLRGLQGTGVRTPNDNISY